MRRRILGNAGIATILLVSLLFAHGGHRVPAGKGAKVDKDGRLRLEPAARTAVRMRLVPVERRTFERAPRFSGRAELPPDRHAFASSLLGGTVSAISVQPGMWVKAGEALAEMESAALENLQLDYLRNKKEIDFLDAALHDAREVYRRIIPRNEGYELETSLEDHWTALLVAEHQLSRAGLSREALRKLIESGEVTRLLPVRAPIEGRILHVHVVPGEGVVPGRHLVEIGDPRELWVRAEVPEDAAVQIRPGAAVRVRPFAFPNEGMAGTVTAVGSQVDPQTRIVPVFCAVANAGERLQPGMLAAVEIVLERRENVLSVPMEAVVVRGVDPYVLMETADGGYERKPVRLGLRDGDSVEVEGVPEGARVVAEGVHELSAFFVPESVRLSETRFSRIPTAEADWSQVDEAIRTGAVVRARPRGETVLTARAAGRIRALSARPGRTVAAGDVLAEIEGLEIQELQLRLVRENLRARLAGRRLEEIRPLWPTTVGARREIFLLETRRAQAEAALQGARRALELAGFVPAEMDRVLELREPFPALPVRAPTPGRVTEVVAALGQGVAPGDPLVRLVDLSRVWVEGVLWERDAARVLSLPSPPQVYVRLDAFPGKEFQGRLESVRALDEEGYLRVWVEVPNEEERLLPGMRGEMRISLGTQPEPVVAVPDEALLSVEGRTFAFVAAETEWQRVPVERGRRGTRRTEVRKGLIPGDTVAIGGIDELNAAFGETR